MKRLWLFGILPFFLWAGPYSQEIIENPERPPAPNAGRIVSAQPLWNIEGTGNDYYLTNPSRIRMSQDGSIFVLDTNKILRFNREGRFMRDYKTGGAESFFISFDLAGDRLIVFDRRERKIHQIGPEGQVEQSFAVEGFYTDFLFQADNRLFFLDQAGGALYSLSLEGKDRRDIAKLPSNQLSESEGPAMRVVTAAVRSVLSPDGKVWLSNQFEYLVHRLDLQKGRVDKSFRRPYKRVAANPSAPQRFKIDIAGFVRRDDCLWVITSTYDPEKGDLIDVYDFEGRYIDNFFLRFSDSNVAASIGFAPKDIVGDEMVFVQRKGTDVAIRKCALKPEAPAR